MTDNTQSSELFELCKEVYKRTGWDDLADDHPWITERDVIGYKRNGVFPLYTSDYLLEKLQSWFYAMGASDFGQFYVTILADACIAKVRSHDEDFSEQASADTLLLALLKLTIALSEAGELNE